jgi:hypothetical protein
MEVQMRKWMLGLLLALLAIPAQAQVVTGTITAGGSDCSVTTRCVTVPTANVSSVVAVITGTWSATLVAEVSGDGGTTWVTVPFINVGTRAQASSLTANATILFLGETGSTHVRIRASSYSSGTVAVAINRSTSAADVVTPTAPPISARPTYIASVSGQATTAAYLLSIESSASTGFRLTKICVGSSGATAAAAVTVTVRRTTTASSGGTALTAEGTGTTAVSKMDSTDSNFGGTARLGGTPGTAGATLDQFAFTVPEIGAGAADPAHIPVFCTPYCLAGEKCPTIPSGVANGLSINVSAAGAGGLAAGAISATFVAE